MVAGTAFSPILHIKCFLLVSKLTKSTVASSDSPFGFKSTLNSSLFLFINFKPDEIISSPVGGINQ